MELSRPPEEQNFHINGCNLTLYSWPRSRQRSNESIEPAIIIEHGLGGTAIEWFAVCRILSTFASVYLCERAGYKPCSPPSREPTLANRALDLRILFQEAQIHSPYLLVGHSYGGMLVRQCLADWPPELQIQGMVLVDAAPTLTPLPESWSTLLGPDTYWSVVGLDANFAMPKDEYERIKTLTAANEGADSIAAWESSLQPDAASQLLKRLQARDKPLSSNPLSVVFCDTAADISKILEHGVKNDHGTLEARQDLRQALRDFGAVEEATQRSMLSLSSNARFLSLEGKGRTHNAQLVVPDVIAEEIRKVYEVACG